MTAADVGAILTVLRETPKYRRLCERVLVRIATEATVAHPRNKEAAKTAKRKLHQIYGAFLSAGALAAVERALAAGRVEDALGLHASTAERLAFLPLVWEAVCGGATSPIRVVDLGAGLMPLSVAQSGLPAGSSYWALDIDEALAALIGRVVQVDGLEIRASTADLVAATPEEARAAGVVMALKLLPTLERQQPGRAASLLKELETVPRLVLSFPVRSLSGRGKGMPEQYEQQLAKWTAGLGRRIERKTFPNETLYVLDYGA